jgi:hypothetical protein
MERHFDAIFMKKYDQPSDEVALAYMAQVKAPRQMRGLFVSTAIRVKRRVYKRLYERRVSGSKRIGAPVSPLKVPVPPLKAHAAAGEELPEAARPGTLPLPPHGDGIWDLVPEYRVQAGRGVNPGISNGSLPPIGSV